MSDDEKSDVLAYLRFPWHEPFVDYHIQSEEPGVGFYSFVLVYTVVVFLLIAPLVSWSRNQEEKQLRMLEADELPTKEQLEEPEPRQPSGSKIQQAPLAKQETGAPKSSKIGDTVQDAVSYGEQRRNSLSDSGRRGSGDSSRRRNSGDSSRRRNSLSDSGRRGSGDTMRRGSGDTMRRGSGDTMRRGSGDTMRRGSGDTMRRGSGETMRRGSGDTMRRGSGDAMRRYSGDSRQRHSGDAMRRYSGDAMRRGSGDSRRRYSVDSTRLRSSGDSMRRCSGDSTRRGSGDSSSRRMDSSGSDGDRIPISRSVQSRKSGTLRSVVLRQFHQSYPDQDPDFRNRIALRFQQHFPQNDIQHGHGDEAINQDQLQTNKDVSGSRSGRGSYQPTETSSSVPSAATTSRIHQSNSTVRTTPTNFRSDDSFSRLVLGVGGRRWKNRKPIGRVDFIERHSSSVAESEGKREGSAVPPAGAKKASMVGSSASNILPTGGRTGFPQHHSHQQRPTKGMSDIASSILSEQYHQLHHQPEVQIDISLMKKHQLEQLQLQQRYLIQHQQFLAMQRIQQRRRFNRRKSTGSSNSDISPSIMSSIIDDIFPDDAADANDPGRGNIFLEQDERYWLAESQYGYQGFGSARAGCCSDPLDGLVSLTAPDYDKWNVLKASIPLTLGASSEALFRLVTVAFISQKLGTESMIAFLLVGLFVRKTSEELAGAIIDALSAFVQAVMDRTSSDPKENNYIAGQYIQLAFLLQLFLNIPLLLVWATFTRQFVIWLRFSDDIAGIAAEYASIVVVAYIVQALSRTLTVIFHISGHEQFESVIDLVASAMQVIAIASVVVVVEGVDLVEVAYIQVLIALASAILKIAYPVASGWMKPYRRGIFQNIAFLNHKAGICHLLKAALPLFLGTVLEYGEWKLFTLFIQQLGPAEVATWALLGAFWDCFEALTEGLGEASANKVAYLLAAGHVNRAKKLCYGSIYMSTIQALLVTSALYMSGQYLAVLFTSDPAIQNIMNNTIVMIGFANVIMAYSRITWSLVGAQGRFRLATFVIFFSRWLVTIPCALISIYVFTLNLNAVSGSLVVGYATACCALSFIVLRSDWNRIVRLMQVMNQPPLLNPNKQQVGEGAGPEDVVNGNDPILGLVNLDDFDDSDDDSDGFGFGDYDQVSAGDLEPTVPSPKEQSQEAGDLQNVKRPRKYTS